MQNSGATEITDTTLPLLLRHLTIWLSLGPEKDLTTVVHWLKQLSTKQSGCDCLLLTETGHLLLDYLISILLISENEWTKGKYWRSLHRDMLSICVHIVTNYQSRLKYCQVIQAMNRHVNIATFVTKLIAKSGLLALTTTKMLHYDPVASRDDKLVLEPLCVRVLDCFDKIEAQSYGRMDFYRLLYHSLMSSFLLRESLAYSGRVPNQWRKRDTLFEKLCHNYLSFSFGSSQADRILYRFSLTQFRNEKFIQRICLHLQQSNSEFILKKLNNTFEEESNISNVLREERQDLFNDILANLLTIGTSPTSRNEVNTIDLSLRIIQKYPHREVSLDTKRLPRFYLLLSHLTTWISPTIQYTTSEDIISVGILSLNILHQFVVSGQNNISIELKSNMIEKLSFTLQSMTLSYQSAPGVNGLNLITSILQRMMILEEGAVIPVIPLSAMSTIVNSFVLITTIVCDETNLEATVCNSMLEMIPLIVRDVRQYLNKKRPFQQSQIIPHALFQPIEAPLEHVSLTNMLLVMMTKRDRSIRLKAKTAILSILSLGHAIVRRESKVVLSALDKFQLEKDLLSTAALTKQVLIYLDESPSHRGYLGRSLLHLSISNHPSEFIEVLREMKLFLQTL